MSNFETSYNSGQYQYLQKVNETFANAENKSLTEVLSDFRLMTDDYHTLSNKNIEFTYSDYDFNKCNSNEKMDFINNQLQFVECLVTDSIQAKSGMPVSWYDIYRLLYDPKYAVTEKTKRKVVFATSGNQRPIGEVSYNIWNGLQIIDLDIKNAEIALKLKNILFDHLKKYHWFLGVCRSASGKGLHVWTKITPISIELKKRKTEYLCNFRHKYSYVYIILAKYASELGYTKEDIFNYMDMAMAKPQQGIFISSDNALMNTNFCDLRLDINFEPAFDTGIESVDWLTHPDLKQIFAKLEWFSQTIDDTKDTKVEIENLVDVSERDYSKSLGKTHYKHAQRWQLANTLTQIFGEEKAFKIMCEICKGTPIRELRGDVHTAAVYDKPLTMWAVNELNRQHGFKIKLKNSDVYKDDIKKVEEEIKNEENAAVDPTFVLNNKTADLVLHLSNKQYLSDLKDDILKNLKHITLLEAGAGYGKTEMIKALKGKTCLILPFTSTIKAKVETSETTKDWLYYYGGKRTTLDELLGNKSMTMTIDKFSKLNLMEVDTADFDYIVIDESHLLFTSSYRDVMSPCIQRLANCKAKIILMTGTPTGEKLFFPNIYHIKVIKEDTRIKTFEVHMCPTADEQLYDMSIDMANDIIAGKKILFPTNKGNLYYDQVIGLIQEHLNDNNFGRELRHFYYKKSNFGEETMDDININKTIGSNDIVFCTTYLSVGVDICDRSTFSVYFNELWIAQDIEQFANRLRNNDLYIKMYLPKQHSDGVYINYWYTAPLDLTFDKNELMLTRDFVRTCNDVIERNENESKYNPVVSSLIAENRYLKYDDVDCKYYIDETTYKLKIFEDRYADYAKQLEVLIKNMKYYGYKYDDMSKLHENEMCDEMKAYLREYMKTRKHTYFNENTAKTQKFLAHITDDNIEFYRRLLGGEYELFKDDKYKEEQAENNLYTESIEIMEKNAPIVLSLYKYYDIETIKNIYDFCTEPKSNKINFTKLNKCRKFANIQANIEKSRLDFPMYKFVREAQKFADDNPLTTQDNINHWVADFAVKYANSIKDLVVNDISYLEKIYELCMSVWKIVIVQSLPKKGKVTLKKFSMDWERKDILSNLYGDRNTKTFFLDELVNIKDESEPETYIELPELPVMPKLTIEQVEAELPNVIHAGFDYAKYSSEDGSNQRFVDRQASNNKLESAMFIQHPTNEPTIEPTTTQADLFNTY